MTSYLSYDLNAFLMLDLVGGRLCTSCSEELQCFDWTEVMHRTHALHTARLWHLLCLLLMLIDWHPAQKGLIEYRSLESLL